MLEQEDAAQPVRSEAALFRLPRAAAAGIKPATVIESKTEASARSRRAAATVTARESRAICPAPPIEYRSTLGTHQQPHAQ